MEERMKLYGGQHVTLVWRDGEEAICSACGNHNACLHTGNIGKATLYECRDCHTMYVVDTGMQHKDLGPQGPLNRPAVERTGIVAGRRLGKQCSECSSFEMKELTHVERQEHARVDRLDWNLAPTHQCQECGKTVRY
jgi:hypothetical protein